MTFDLSIDCSNDLILFYKSFINVYDDDSFFKY